MKGFKEMNKTELVKKIAEDLGFTQKDVRTVLDTYEETVMKTLADGDSVKTGIMTFTVKDTKPRTARNLHTGETINVPAGKKVAIKVSKNLKECVK
jgi:DNA-binding protein HU-beta